jgi:secondary thiamine-phosphate synthase enzyme
VTAHVHSLSVATQGKGLYPFTRHIAAWLRSVNAGSGLLTIFIQHTSASLIIQENADPDVVLDLRDYFEELVPEDDGYRHHEEGPDDMPAHIRAALTQTSLSIPVSEGKMMLGMWQGIYVFEHRSAAQQRNVVLQLLS